MFDKSRFMDYLEEYYGLDGTSLNLVENVVDYAMENHGHQKNGVSHIIYSIIWESTYILPQEIKQFEW